jgi:hypothetical protein
MDNTNKTTNTENLLPKLKNPTINYFLAFGMLFLIIMVIIMWVYFDNGIKINYTPGSSMNIKSQQQLVADIFIILFVSILIICISIIFLPNLKEFKDLFLQIGNVTYIILYTIFVILFYTMMPSNILNNYSNIINPFVFGLGAIAFYKGITENYIDKFNINYERIKMLIIMFCLITLIITFYNINPGGEISKYFGYTLLLTIIISVFAFLYLIILLTLPDNTNKPQQNILSNFSMVGKYGTILFVIFLVVVSILIAYNRDSFFNNQPKAASIIIMLLLISILWSCLLGINLFSGFTNNALVNSKMNIFKKSLLVLFGLIISGLIIYWITYNVERLSSDSSIVSFILNLLLVVIILALIYRTINVHLPAGNTKKNAFFTLIGNTILYIPCLVSGLFDGLGNFAVGQYNATNAGSFIMLLIAIILVVIYFSMPTLFNSISSQGGKLLVNKPVYTDTLYNLGSYQELNGSDNFDYQYAISCWVFIDAMPPNTNSNYTKYTSLLNFGDKPNILYNSEKNTLMITMQQKDLDKTTKNTLLDFDKEGNRIIYQNKNMLLQKWNNIIVNYNGGTLDIFLNGELVKSSIEVAPYYTFESLTIGENNGIKGGICNVVYFRHALTSSNIYYIYNTVKNRTPPTLNDSNVTIMKQNINEVSNSAKTVT